MTRHDGCKVLVCHYFHVQSFSNYREIVLRDLALGSLIPDILPLVYTFAFEFTFHYTDRDLVIADRDVSTFVAASYIRRTVRPIDSGCHKTLCRHEQSNLRLYYRTFCHR